MRNVRCRLATMALGLTLSSVASAQIQPAANSQPSLVMSQVYALNGDFPTTGPGYTAGDTIGFVHTWAGNFGINGEPLAQGQVRNIAQNTAAFSIIGTTYGGNGTTTYAIPNLTGRAIVGASGNLGAVTGNATITFNDAQTAGTAPFDNRQPSLALTPLIAVSNNYTGSASNAATFIGQVAHYAGALTPSGWVVADGSMLQIQGNEQLFNVIGNTYGGNGLTTFALPDLIGRVAVGASTANPLGTEFGADQTLLTAANLPAGGTSGAPVNNDEASLSLNFLIALSGIFPSRDGSTGFDMGSPYLGQVTAFAGSTAPTGWAFANGQLLSIQTNTALFALLGTTYGGNGVTTFALPDLRGTTIIGSGLGYSPGTRFGSDTFTLAGTAATTPAVPEPATWAMMLLGFAGIGASLRRRRSASTIAQVA